MSVIVHNLILAEAVAYLAIAPPLAVKSKLMFSCDRQAV